MAKEPLKLLSFSVSEKEQKAINKFIKKQMKKHKKVGTIGDRFSYAFTPTGIGTGVSVIDGWDGSRKDCTDYDNW